MDTPNTPIVAKSSNNPPITALDGLINLWLHGKAPHTARYYRSNAKKFFAWVDKPIEQVTLADGLCCKNFLRTKQF